MGRRCVQVDALLSTELPKLCPSLRLHSLSASSQHFSAGSGMPELAELRLEAGYYNETGVAWDPGAIG